jgi:hypothetical protein
LAMMWRMVEDWRSCCWEWSCVMVAPRWLPVGIRRFCVARGGISGGEFRKAIGERWGESGSNVEFRGSKRVLRDDDSRPGSEIRRQEN